MEAFMELYKEVYQDLYPIAFYYMGNPTEAEDAVSEAVLKAYEHFDGLRDLAAFRNWMIKILVNTCKKRMRSWFRKEAEWTDDVSEQRCHTPDYSLGPAMTAAFGALNREERLIVVLYVLGGYKGTEIAQILGKKHSTIRSKYRRALEKLREQLQE